MKTQTLKALLTAAILAVATTATQEQGAMEVIIEGGVRTTGANIGKTPIPIRVKVE